jgi:hypothetical protein
VEVLVQYHQRIPPDALPSMRTGEGKMKLIIHEMERAAELEVISRAVMFMDQLNSFNNFYHPEVHRRALDLQKAGSEYHKHKNSKL